MQLEYTKNTLIPSFTTTGADCFQAFVYHTFIANKIKINKTIKNRLDGRAGR